MCVCVYRLVTVPLEEERFSNNRGSLGRAVMELGLGFPAHSCFSRPAISHTVDWADGLVPDSNLSRWVGAPAEITR